MPGRGGEGRAGQGRAGGVNIPYEWISLLHEPGRTLAWKEMLVKSLLHKRPWLFFSSWFINQLCCLHAHLTWRWCSESIWVYIYIYICILRCCNNFTLICSKHNIFNSALFPFLSNLHWRHWLLLFSLTRVNVTHASLTPANEVYGLQCW